MLGPVRSMSRMPTLWPCWVRARASWIVTLDLPTPPLPERMRTTCFMLSSPMVVITSHSRLSLYVNCGDIGKGFQFVLYCTIRI